MLDDNISEPKSRCYRFFSGLVSLCKSNWWLLLLSVAFIIFALLLEDVLSGEIMRLDTWAYTFFVAYLRNDAITPIMEGFSALASPIVIVVMALVLISLLNRPNMSWVVCINLLVTLTLNQTLKFIIQRPRPDGFRLVAESGYSFPSGHSMISMAFFGLLVWLVWKSGAPQKKRMFWCCVFSFIICCIGISRIYLGVHYASDVIAGFCASLIWLLLYTRIIVPLLVAPKVQAKDTK